MREHMRWPFLTPRLMLDSDSWTASQVLTVRVWVAVCKSENVKHGPQGKTRNDPKERAIRTSFKIKTQETRAIQELSLSPSMLQMWRAGEAAKAAKHIGGAVVKIEPGALAGGASTVAKLQKNHGGAKQALVRYTWFSTTMQELSTAHLAF